MRTIITVGYHISSQPIAHYDAFIACAKDPEVDKRSTKLNILTDDLPTAHRHVLAFLVRHLNNVEAHKGENKVLLPWLHVAMVMILLRVLLIFCL